MGEPLVIKASSTPPVAVPSLPATSKAGSSSKSSLRPSPIRAPTGKGNAVSDASGVQDDVQAAVAAALGLTISQTTSVKTSRKKKKQRKKKKKKAKGDGISAPLKVTSAAVENSKASSGTPCAAVAPENGGAKAEKGEGDAAYSSNEDYSDDEDEGQEGYRPGGYHKVSVGEKYNSGAWVVKEKLGWGHFSTVWLAENSRTGKHAALKVQKSAEHYTDAAMDEIDLLRTISKLTPPGEDKYLVELMDSFSHRGPNGTHVCMVFEVLGDNLLNLIKHHKYRGVPMRVVKQVAFQVCVALDFLHTTCKIIHTDLKPENVLICGLRGKCVDDYLPSLPALQTCARVNREEREAALHPRAKQTVNTNVEYTVEDMDRALAELEARLLSLPVDSSDERRRIKKKMKRFKRKRKLIEKKTYLLKKADVVPVPDSVDPPPAVPPPTQSANLPSSDEGWQRVLSKAARQKGRAGENLWAREGDKLDTRFVAKLVRRNFERCDNSPPASALESIFRLTSAGDQLPGAFDYPPDEYACHVCMVGRPQDIFTAFGPPGNEGDWILELSPTRKKVESSGIALVRSTAHNPQSVLSGVMSGLRSAGSLTFPFSLQEYANSLRCYSIRMDARDVSCILSALECTLSAVSKCLAYRFIVAPHGGPDDLLTTLSSGYVAPRTGISTSLDTCSAIHGIVFSVDVPDRPCDGIASRFLPVNSRFAENVSLSGAPPSAHAPPYEAPRARRIAAPEVRAVGRGAKLPKFLAGESEIADITVKVVDLGNACWVHKHFSEDIQTRQYRSAEVILGVGYDTPADIWSLACLIFELATGDLLFDPRSSSTYERDEDHLALMMELLGPVPRRFWVKGKYSRDIFNRKGELKNIKDLKFWPLEDVLREKYSFDDEEAELFASFLTAMLDFDTERRLTAAEALKHPWLSGSE